MTSEGYLRAVEPKPHRYRSAPTPATRQLDDNPRALRDRTVAADEAATVEVNLGLLWRELVSGLCRVVDGFFSDDRCYLVLAPSQSAPEPIEGRRREILEAVLCGLGQKNIAMDLRIAPSTVALNARLALESLGLRCKPSRVHPLLMLAARASRERECGLTAKLSFIQHAGQQLRVVAGPRPDQRLSEIAPPAELAVVRSLVEGLCYQDIARRRGTSTRTIANQITAVFRRLRVSGRNELLQRLFFVEGAGHSPLPPARRETLVPPESTARRSA